MGIQNKHLRFKGRQWQFIKRLPKEHAQQLGKQFFVKNLGTADLVVARKLRDRLVAELQDLAGKPSVDEAAILTLYQSLSDDQQEAYEYWLQDIAERMEAKGEDGVAWYRRVTGQVLPVAMNVEQYLKEKPAATTTQQARRSAVNRFVAWLPDDSLVAVTRRKAGEYVSHLASGDLAARSVNSQVSHLSAYWKWLEKRGIRSAMSD